MEIIDGLLGPLPLTKEERKVVMRVVHTTGDPDYAQIVAAYPGAVEAGIAAFRRGASIFTDVNMVRTGINKRKLAELGGEATCLIDDPEVMAKAKETGLTRAMTAFSLLAPRMDGQVVAIGNAPTALFQLMEEIQKGRTKPALVVGVPVGFVGAAESKELLAQMDIPWITVRGNKGGSPIAAAIVNAMLLMA
jgi:precorrin-8X/cobalt-precorrin-8 methylmutase